MDTYHLSYSDLELPKTINKLVGRKGSQKKLSMDLSKYKVIFWGLDTLHLTYRGTINKLWWENAFLKERKEFSQRRSYKPFIASTGEVVDSLCVTIGEQDWMVSSKGNAEFAYCLLRGDYRIFIFSTRGFQKNVNQLKIEIPSSRLRRGLDGLREDIDYWLNYLMSSHEEFVQRVDLTTDIEGFDLSTKDQLVFRGRPRKMELINSDLENRHYFTLGQPEKLETVTIGKNPRLKIYDKLNWAIQTDLDWFLIWYGMDIIKESSNPKDGKLIKHPPITRFEFQLRRDLLSSFQINNFESLQENIQGLWSYLTCEWLDCKRKVPEIKNIRNLPTAGIWEFLRKVPFGTHVPISRVRPFKKDPSHNIDQFLGHLSSIIAKEDIPVEGKNKAELVQSLTNISHERIFKGERFNSEKFNFQLKRKRLLYRPSSNNISGGKKNENI